ncbi:MAG: hypothetical protein AAGI07_00680 [Bacteroidota bacterium]
MEKFKNDQHHLDKYKAFCELYELDDFEKIIKNYDIFDLVSFFPARPTTYEKNALQNLIGVVTESGYMDYQKTNNTFELIMQWREKTNNLPDSELFLR